MTGNQINISFALRAVIYASAFYLFLMTILNLNLDVILLTTIYIILTLLLLEKILLYVYIVHVSLLLILLFCFGFYLQLGLIIYDPYLFGYSGFTSLGNFDFEFSQFLEIYLVTVVSTIGILSGLFLATKNNIKELYDANVMYSKKQKVKKKYINILIIFWFIFSISFYYFNDYLGIGRHGLENKTELPRFVGGFLILAKSLYVTGIAFCIYDILIKNSFNWNKIFYFLFFFTLCAFLALEFTFSRSAIIYRFFPFMLLLVYYGKNQILKGYAPGLTAKFFFYFILLLIMISFLIGYIEQKRAIAYTDTIEEFKFIGILELLKLFIVRIEGVRDLFLVTDYQNKGLEAYLNVNLGRFSPADELYGFSLEGTKFGLTVGFQGLSFLSGSYLVTFLHSLIFIFLLCKLEIFFKVRGLFTFSIYITTVLTLLVWMNIDLYSCFRFFVIIFLIYFSALLLKKYFWIDSLKKLIK